MSSATPKSRRRVPALVRPSQVAFAVAAWLFAACVGIQIYLAGMGVFAGARNFLTHRDFGYLFGTLTLVLLALSLAGRLPRVLITASVLLLALFTLQSILIAFREQAPMVAALHPLNGFVIFAVALAVAWSSRVYLGRATAEFRRTETPTERDRAQHAGGEQWTGG